MPDGTATPAPKKPKSFNFAIPFILITGLLGLAGFLILRSTARSGVAERRGYSAKNLETMGQQLVAAKFPDDPNALFAAQPELTINPSWPEQVGYSYVAGVTAADPAETILLFENVPPEKRKIGRQVLTLAGKVELLPEDAFQQRLREQQSRWADEHRPWRLVPVGKDRSYDAV